MCTLPSLRSVALHLSSLVLSLQGDVPLGGLTEEEQNLDGWGGGVDAGHCSVEVV